MSVYLLLVCIALLLTILSIAWPKPFVLPTAVLLLCVALLIASR